MSVWNFGIWDLDFWSFDFGILGFGIWDDLDFGILDLTCTMFQTPNYRFCILTPFSPISSKSEFGDINCNNWAQGMIITANLQWFRPPTNDFTCFLLLIATRASWNCYFVSSQHSRIFQGHGVLLGFHPTRMEQLNSSCALNASTSYFTFNTFLRCPGPELELHRE